MENKIAFLKTCKGNNTTLVSLIIPQGSNIWLYDQRLTKEFSLTGNIKSKQTRDDVRDAIKSMKMSLKLFNSVPLTGLALFSGWHVWQE